MRYKIRGYSYVCSCQDPWCAASPSGKLCGQQHLLPECCSCSLGSFHPLGPAGYTWLWLQIPHLPRVSQVWRGKGCVSKQTQSPATAHSQACQLLGQGGQLQMPAQMSSPCEAATGPDILHMASTADTRIQIRGTQWCPKAWWYHKLQSPKEGVTTLAQGPPSSGLAEGCSSSLLVTYNVASRGHTSALFVLQLFQSYDSASLQFLSGVQEEWSTQTTGGWIRKRGASLSDRMALRRPKVSSSFLQAGRPNKCPTFSREETQSG